MSMMTMAMAGVGVGRAGDDDMMIGVVDGRRW